VNGDRDYNGFRRIVSAHDRIGNEVRKRLDEGSGSRVFQPSNGLSGPLFVAEKSELRVECARGFDGTVIEGSKSAATVGADSGVSESGTKSAFGRVDPVQKLVYHAQKA